MSALLAVAYAGTDDLFPEVTRIEQLTHDGLVKNSPFVGDGSHIYLSGADGYHFRYRIDGGQAVRENSIGGFHFLDISPRRREALGIKPGDRGAEDALWIIPLDDYRAAHRLAMVKTDGLAVWSSDGERVAYVRDRSLFVATRGGTSVRQLNTFEASIHSIRWAPDGQTIRTTVSAANDRRVTLTIWDVDVASGAARGVFPEHQAPADLSSAGWVRGDSNELFVGPYAAPQVWMRHAHQGWVGGTQVLRQLTSDSMRFTDPVPNPDGTRIYALGQAAPLLLRYDHGRDKFLPYLGGISAFNVLFSPDRTWAAYIRFPDLTLWRAAADGSNARPLTRPPMRVEGAAISPDGKRLAIRAGYPVARQKGVLAIRRGRNSAAARIRGCGTGYTQLVAGREDADVRRRSGGLWHPDWY